MTREPALFDIELHVEIEINIYFFQQKHEESLPEKNRVVNNIDVFIAEIKANVRVSMTKQLNKNGHRSTLFHQPDAPLRCSG